MLSPSWLARELRLFAVGPGIAIVLTVTLRYTAEKIERGMRQKAEEFKRRSS
jgi:hypothetical protein